MQATIPATAYTIRKATFEVPGTKPGTTYTVTMDLTTQTAAGCTCKDFEFRGHQRPCKHMLAVEAGQAGKPRIAIRPRPVAACALCGQQREHTIDAAGYVGLSPGSRICPPWVYCPA